MKLYCGIYTNMSCLSDIVAILLKLSRNNKRICFCEWQRTGFDFFQHLLKENDSEEEVPDPEIEALFYLDSERYVPEEYCPGSKMTWYNLPLLSIELVCDRTTEEAILGAFQAENRVLDGDQLFKYLTQGGYVNPGIYFSFPGIVDTESNPIDLYRQFECQIA